MRAEMKRMLSGRGFLAGVFLAMLGMVLGAEYPKIEGTLEPGSFLSMVRYAMTSKTALFFLPVAAVLPWSDSFLGEWKGGFLKSILPRCSRSDYVQRKIAAVALGGILSWIVAGIFLTFCFFLIFFPMEKRGEIPMETVTEFLGVLVRAGLLGGILSSLGGIFGTLTGSVYMAYGLPFVGYYFCMILQERYFEDALWIYPPEWIAGMAQWGESHMGLYLFLLLFLGAVVGIHGGVLYERLEEF